MKRFFVLVLILLTIFSSCKNRSFTEYIEQGFSKPTVSDVHFSKSNIGDGNKLYVPSEENIDVQFTIKNRYAKELRGSLQFDEAKKALFDTEPFIKELTPTKMVVAFNFKEEAEPKAVNSFLGELVEVTVNIFEKRTGRYLSSQTVKLGCNTPPEPIKETDIVYDGVNDKFIVTLPQEIRKHKDLKEVKFTLSDSLGNVAREAKVVSIASASEQGIPFTLEVKGFADWQLNPPVGQRRLKAVVYDKAGLKSGEKEGKPTRLFTAITLEPENQPALRSDLKNGVPVPKIKELEEFANGDGWKNDDTYRVTYNCPGFTYHESESGGKKTGYLKNENAAIGVSYTVTVTLEQGGNPANNRSATYTIVVVGDNTTELDKSAITVEDITDTYNNVAEQRLTFLPNSISFTTSSDNTEEGRLEIPYTGSETKLKVYIKAISDKCKGEDDNGTKWSPQHEKTYEITIPETSSSTKHIVFKITAPDGYTSKNYDIKFTRGESVKVTLEFKNEPTLTGNKKIATGKVLWETYKKSETIEYNPDNALTNNKREITVRKDSNVKFTINPIDLVKVKKCRSTIDAHNTSAPPNTSSAVPTGCEGLVLKASDNFTLTVLLRPEASIKWKNYQAPTPTYYPGYTKGQINYTPPLGTNTEVNLVGGDQGLAVKNGTSAIFKLDGFSAETHFVEKWIVKHGDVTDDVTSNVTDKYELGTNNSTLKIVKVEGEYEVEVIVKKFCRVVVKIGQDNGSDFEIFTDTGHKHKIVAKNNASPTPPLSPDEASPTNTYTFSKIKPNTVINFKPESETGSVYEFVKWKYKEVSFGGGYSSSSNATGELEKEIKEDMEVLLVLKKTTFNVSWGVEGGNAKITAKVGGTTLTSSTSEYNVEKYQSTEFTASNIPSEKNIKGWKVDGVLYENTDSGKGITISTDKKKLTLSNIQATHRVKLVLETKKYTVTVEIEKPAEENKYTISAEAGSTVLDNKATPPAYRYEGVEHGTLLTLRATPNDSRCVVIEWKHKPSGTSTWQHFSGNVAFITSTIEGNTDFKVTLKYKPVKFTLVRKGSVSGKLEIRTSPTGTPEIASVNGTPIEVGVASEQTRFYLKVAEMMSIGKIVSWKLNGNKENAKTNFLKNDGFWKGEGYTGKFHVLLNAGDEVEVTIAPVQQINLRVQAEDGTQYTGNYNLVIKQSESDKTNEDHILLPIKGNNGVEITKESEYGYPMYITKGTKLDFEMKNLSEDNKEIGEWKKDDGEILGDKFNENFDDNALRVGRLEVKNYDSFVTVQPENIFIIAKIRNKTSLATFSIKDYKNKNKTNDGNIKLKVVYADGGASIADFSGNDGEFKCRVLSGKKIKLKIEEENGHQYYFAEWEGDVSDGNKFKKEIEIDVPNKSFTVSALCTKTVVVRVHSMLPNDRHGGNLDSGWFPNPTQGTLGYAKVGKINGANFEEKASIQCDIGGVHVSDIPIPDFTSENGGNLAIKYWSSIPLYKAKVYWKYAFGGDSGTPQYNTENDNVGIAGGGELILKFKNPSQCVVLHIWLYKVKQKP